MASKVKAVLCSYITGYDHLDGEERPMAVKDDVRKFIAAVIENNSCNIFDEFASNLVKELEKCFFACVSSDVPFRSKHVKREKLWRCFHRLRARKINRIWCKLFSEDIIPKLSPLVYQSVTQKLYSDIISCHLGATLDDIRDPDNDEACSLSVDEENILRYVAGYVPFKLLKQYEKSKVPEAVNVIECLL